MLRSVLLLALLAGAVTGSAQAGPPRKTHPGYGTSGYVVRIKKVEHGHVRYQYTYPGKHNGFPPPAFLYYGYPGSGHSYGPGF